MKTALNNIIAHSVQTLPDSLAARKKLLSDLLAVAGDGHPQRPEIFSMLTMLEAHEKLQADFFKHLTEERSQ